MLNLGSRLHSKGFSIVIAHTQFNHSNPSGFPCFTFASVPDCLPKAVLTSGDPAAVVVSLNTSCGGPLCQVLSDMMAEDGATESKISCVIYDMLMHCAEAAAHYMKLPSMALRTSRLVASALSWFSPNCLGYKRKVIFSGKDRSLKDPVPGAYPLSCKDLPLFPGDIELMMQLSGRANSLKTSSAVLWNTVDCLEKQLSDKLQKQYQVPLSSLGPLHKVAPASPTRMLEEETDCLLWLDKQADNSVIYVSLGSLALMEAGEFAQMAWGLANSGQPFSWVVQPGSVGGSEWVELLPEGFQEATRETGCVVRWAPQKDALAHHAAGGFWTHGGWNSTLVSVSEGVPMICRPCFGNQNVNARYLCYVRRVGFELEGDLDQTEVEQAVRRLMMDEEGEEMRRRAAAFKDQIELSIREGGSSHTAMEELVNLIISL
ncbi:UDP-glucose iridoid glucosyltransferase-like [Rhodamnia argentea]|uniref:UDP-glucose iridoid glucosyltransferase-like n=1 Tax=Rhodamnia argentea TaxID=178133 RepID=A0A8B8NPF3_9MYRT|nr:UDP-glucose iridoid glucosyltransferase-like [Rhodamnia argentea]